MRSARRTGALARAVSRIEPRVLAAIVAALSIAVVWLVVIVANALLTEGSESASPPNDTVLAVGVPPWATTIPVPLQEGAVPTAADDTAVEPRTAVDSCGDSAVDDAVASGDDAAVIAAFGGPERFREQVAGGDAPCVDLADPTRIWVVVNKARPLDPADYAPDSTVAPAEMTNSDPSQFRVRPDAAEALAALTAGARAEGIGDLGLNNGFRPFSSQERLHRESVARLGEVAGEQLTLRPGYSEHQTGLAADVMSCGNGCGSLEAFGETDLGAWVRDHSWEYGWIIRYEPGRTDVTGIDSEPWHLRYIGVDLARAYHEGGWSTLEEFFGLPAAPDYPG